MSDELVTIKKEDLKNLFNRTLQNAELFKLFMMACKHAIDKKGVDALPVELNAAAVVVHEQLHKLPHIDVILKPIADALGIKPDSEKSESSDQLWN